jgi:hypothetical protein
VREFFLRFVVILVAVVITCAGVTAAFGFFCFAIYAWLATALSPALAAVLTGLLILVGTGLIVACAGAWLRVRFRRPKDKSPFAFGKALGELFGVQYRAFMKDNPSASTIMSAVAGFMAGADHQ